MRRTALAVGGDHDRRALVALADDLEQQVYAALVDRQVAELVNSCRAQHNWVNSAICRSPRPAASCCSI
jgi:hypothetical protein